MVYMNLQNVDLTYPLYGVSSQSVRKKIINIATGGIIGDKDNIPVINALDNINFSLQEGDRVGLIGHNGAGKSSLLKVLAGIYEPTSGKLNYKGKIVSTLNISVGMDNEATGVENIITRCLFHGLTRKEIALKLDDIKNFTDLGDYLNMPIRIYSSGMQTRVAFSAVTSIDSDILLMDEIIGTGDANFLSKAERRLLNFMNKSKILVLASHSDDVIRKFCNKVIILEHGKLKFFGPTEQAFLNYYAK
jgi:ABC-2 type transport system ATP-binding protein